MRAKYLMSFAFAVSALSAFAQFDMGGFAGTCLYEGDITNNFIGKANVGVGGTLRYNVTPYFATRMGLFYGRVGADDKQARQISHKRRNLNFKSPIVELSLTGEYNIFGYNSGSRRRYPGMVRSKWSPYLFGGVSYFYFNPTTTYLGSVVKLRDIPTEQKKNYSTMQLAIPMGVGVKYNFERFWTIGFELGFRKTFTDYIDDVSGNANNIGVIDPKVLALADRSGELHSDGASSYKPGFGRGNSKNLDAYTFIGVTIAKDLGNTYGRRRR